MKKTIFVCAAGLGLLLGCATPSAQHAARSPATTRSQVSAPEETDAETTELAAAADQTDGEKVICESGPTTGSRLPRVVCRTPLQIEQEREASERWLRDGQRLPRFQ
jgi:hypothetical protein